MYQKLKNWIKLQNIPGDTTILNLSNSQLTGSIPDSISSLCNLQILYLNKNQLTGLIPDSISNLCKLQKLYLDENQLTGSIPGSISNLTNLQELHLNSNKLTGSIPDSISNLCKLQKLFFTGNELTGSIPDSISSLSNLQELHLNKNELTGSIPDSISNLSNLQKLYLDKNQLTGSIPDSILNLCKLQELYLYRNQLTGSIPDSISRLSNLQELFLHENQLTGSIPDSISNLCKLQELSLYNNKLTGSIPDSISNLCNLRYLWLNNNELTGSIPDSISNLSNLQELYLHNNQLTGSIPDSISNLSNLQELLFTGNQLTGSIPDSISRLSNLQYLYLSKNQLTGSIPDSISSLCNLVELNIQNNFFNTNSSIPESFITKTDVELEEDYAYENVILIDWIKYYKEYNWNKKDIINICTTNNVLSNNRNIDKKSDLINIPELSICPEQETYTWDKLHKITNPKYIENNIRLMKKITKIVEYDNQCELINKSKKDLEDKIKQIKDEIEMLNDKQNQIKVKKQKLQKQVKKMIIPSVILSNVIPEIRERSKQNNQLNEILTNRINETNNFEDDEDISKDDITLFLHKLNLSQYIPVFMKDDIYEEINANEELHIDDLGMTIRDSSLLLYHLDMIKYPKYMNMIDKEYYNEIECYICECNTVLDTIGLLQDWEIDINYDIIRNNHWIAPMLLYTNRYKDAFELSDKQSEELERKLLKWKKYHNKHKLQLKSINNN